MDFCYCCFKGCVRMGSGRPKFEFPWGKKGVVFFETLFLLTKIQTKVLTPFTLMHAFICKKLTLLLYQIGETGGKLEK